MPFNGSVYISYPDTFLIFNFIYEGILSIINVYYLSLSQKIKLNNLYCVLLGCYLFYNLFQNNSFKNFLPLKIKKLKKIVKNKSKKLYLHFLAEKFFEVVKKDTSRIFLYITGKMMSNISKV